MSANEAGFSIVLGALLLAAIVSYHVLTALQGITAVAIP